VRGLHPNSRAEPAIPRTTELVAAFRIPREDLPVLGLGAGLTCASVLAAQRVGEMPTLALLGGLVVFGAFVVGFVAAPRVTVALVIPLFALLPTLKLLVNPNLGPLKDLVSVAAIAAGAAILIKANSSGERLRGDFWIGVLVAAIGALYVLNLGGSLEWNVAWAHGVRLVVIPLLLLLVGLALGDSRRTFDWALGSLVATGCFVALVGLAQQQIGIDRLNQLGFEFDEQLRTIGDRLRSFGTLDDPFVYATFLLFALAAVIFWMRRGPLAYLAATLIAAGLAVSFVRTAAIAAVALLGLWLAQKGQTAIAAYLLGGALLVGAIVFSVASGGTESRQVRTSQGSSYLTINERTTGWKLLFADTNSLPLGKGVGEVGTAAERASYTLTRRNDDSGGIAVDSGYLATVADIGLVGLALLLLLFARILALARRGIRQGLAAGWMAVAITAIMLIDALTRESFTSYPNAFLGFLLLGLALAAAAPTVERRRSVAR
jgi:uncharacterized membrane protein YhaH (DUF805 family)